MNPNTRQWSLIASSLLAAVCLCWHLTPDNYAQARSNRNASRADFDRLMKELSNWGRWGKDDQMGAVNLITPAKRKQSVSEGKEGFSISMARKAEIEPALDNPRPITHVMNAGRATPPARQCRT